MIGAVIGITYGVMFCLTMAIYMARHRGTLGDGGDTFFFCLGTGLVWFITIPYLLILGIIWLIEWGQENAAEQKREKETKQRSMFRCVFCGKDNDSKMIYCGFCGQKLVKSNG